MNAAPQDHPPSFSAVAADAVRGWDRFWFRPADPTPLGLIRIFCGLVTLYVHLAYTYDLHEFLGADAWFNVRLANEFRHEAPWMAPPLGWQEGPDPRPLPASRQEQEQAIGYVERWGVDPRLATARGNVFWSVWYHVTDPAAMLWVHGGVLVILVLFTAGCCTRVTAVLAWLAALSYIQRSPMTLFGMDTIMVILLLYLMIGPSGAALSVDRLFARWWAARRDEVLPPPPPSASANLALRLMQVHFCFIYLAAGLSKLLGSSWWNGTALWWTLANYEFTPLRFPYYAEALRALCRHRWLWELAMTGGVTYTLALEIAFPFLVWNRHLRGWLVTGAVLLHTGIAFTMGLVGFGLMMLALVLSFVPAPVVRGLLTWSGRNRRKPAESASGVTTPSRAA